MAALRQHQSPAPSSAGGAHSSQQRRLPKISVVDLLSFFHSHVDSEHPPEKLTLNGICETANDLTPRSRRAVLNCGIDFHDEVCTAPSLANLPAAARGVQEAEKKWLQHLGRRRLEVVEALAAERARLSQEQMARDRQAADSSQFRLKATSPGPGADLHSSRASSSGAGTPRSGTAGGGRPKSPATTIANGGKAGIAGMDPAEYQAARAARQEQAMLDAIKKKVQADERLREHEERSIALAQLTLQRQRQQERAAQKARERAEALAEAKRKERAETEAAKLEHRREVQALKEQLEEQVRRQQEQEEREKDMTVEERRAARMQRLREQRRELEKRRIEQQNRLQHLQRNIEEAEERRRDEYLERMRAADIARQKQMVRKEELLAMHSEYSHTRTQIYQERRVKLEDAHVHSITRFKEKGQSAEQKREEILAERQAALKARILEHAERELQARRIRQEVEKAEEEEARQLEQRLREQEKRSHGVLQHKNDASKIRLAEKQLVAHDHKMHAMHIHRMQEVREQALQKQVLQKVGRIEQLKEDQKELDVYRKSLRHILDSGHVYAHGARNTVSPARRGGKNVARARTPAPSSASAAYDTEAAERILMMQNHHHNNQPAPSAPSRMEPASSLPAMIRGNQHPSSSGFPQPRTPEPGMMSRF